VSPLVVVVSSIGTGAEKEIVQQTETMGTNLLMVRPAQVKSSAARKQIRGVVSTLTVEDYEVISDLAAVQAAVPGLENTLTAKAGSVSMSALVLGTTAAYLQVCRFAVKRGRFIDDDDNRQARLVAVLGAPVNEELFPGRDAIRQDIRIRGVPVEVIGVLQAKGILADGSDEDNQILIPIRAALRRVFNLNWLNPIFVSVRDPNQMIAAETEMAQVLRVRHRLEPGGKPDDFAIQNKSKVLATQKQIADSLTNLAMGLAGVSLCSLGGIGILALMLMSVKERTGEIGLRIAVGARRADILLQFLSGIAGRWRLVDRIDPRSVRRGDGCFLRSMESRTLTPDAACFVCNRARCRPRLWNLAGLEGLLNSAHPCAPGGIMNPRADSMNPACTARTKVLVIDDDERLNTLLTQHMDRFGFSVRSAVDLKGALRALKLDPPDIVILDVMLPDVDGFAVCRKVREASCVPIIMLTARGDVMDRIVGLELVLTTISPSLSNPANSSLTCRQSRVVVRIVIPGTGCAPVF
jgi:putative ABC transport system permease protein